MRNFHLKESNSKESTPKYRLLNFICDCHT